MSLQDKNVLNINDLLEYNATKNIVVTGVTGQDGSHMVDYLLKNTDYTVFGGIRRSSVCNHNNIKHIDNNNFHLVNFDLTDSHSITRIIEILKPSYFINLAAQSFVAASWDFAKQTWETNSTAVLDILEAIRQYHPTCRLYNAGSSEEMGNIIYSPQDEKHPSRARSPYAASKSAARQLVKVYRESYNLYAIQGWLYNHESERRGEEFVTRKITKGVARIVKCLKNATIPTPIELGNLNASRDWSYAPDFIDGIWRMLNQEFYRWDLKTKIPSPLPTSYCTSESYKKMILPELKDYVLASGRNHTIREFIEEAFKCAGIKDGVWTGTDINETYSINRPFENGPLTLNLVTINPKYYRPAEVDTLTGDASRAKKELGWNPKTSFKELVNIMVTHDMETLMAE